MPDQVPETVKKARSGELLALVEEQSKAFRDYYIGKEQTVLFEENMQIGAKRYMVGFTPEYVRLAMELAPDEAASDYTNRLCTGTVAGVLTEELYLFARD